MPAIEISFETSAADTKTPPVRQSGISGLDRRRFTRRETRKQAMMYIGYEHTDCDVLDVSEEGARIIPRLLINRRVIVLKVPGIKARVGTVVWQRDGQLGIRFRQRLGGDLLEDLVRSADENSSEYRGLIACPES